MNRKFMSAAALVVSGVMALSGCSKAGGGTSESYDGKENDYDNTAVATVDGVDVKLSDFNFAYYTTAGYYSAYTGGGEGWEDQEMGGQKLGDYVRDSSLDEMKQLVMAEIKAPEYGVKVDNDSIKTAEDQKKDVIENNFGGEDGYNEYLDSYFTSDAAVTRYLIRANLINDLLAKMSEEGGECEVTTDELEYNDDKYLKVKHVLIKTGTDNDGNQIDEAEALSKANEVIEKLNAGEDMDVLIEQYGEDPGMESQDYYVFTEGEMVDEFYQASKDMEIGSWSQEPVKSSYGYHIIQRYALDPENDDKVNELKTQKAQEKFMTILEGWVDEADITVDDKAITSALDAQREQAAAKAAENESGSGDEDLSSVIQQQTEATDEAADDAADVEPTPADEPETADAE